MKSEEWEVYGQHRVLNYFKHSLVTSRTQTSSAVLLVQEQTSLSSLHQITKGTDSCVFSINIVYAMYHPVTNQVRLQERVIKCQGVEEVVNYITSNERGLVKASLEYILKIHFQI